MFDILLFELRLHRFVVCWLCWLEGWFIGPERPLTWDLFQDGYLGSQYRTGLGAKENDLQADQLPSPHYTSKACSYPDEDRYA